MRHIQRDTFWRLGFCLVLLVPLLAACRSEEQGRITMYKPGEYLGGKQGSLSQEQVRGLRYRTVNQSGVTKPSGGGGSISVDDIDTGLLGQRTINQGGS